MQASDVTRAVDAAVSTASDLDLVVDEAIVVDTGSTDRTPQIAQARKAKVFKFDWQEDYAAARNYARAQATGQWILILDSDEALAPDAQVALNQDDLEPASLRLSQPGGEKRQLRGPSDQAVHRRSHLPRATLLAPDNST